MIKKLFRKLTKQESQNSAIPDLFFKDNAAAFEYACKYCVTNIVAKQGLISLVEMAPEKDERGNTYCVVNVSATNGGFTVPAMIAGGDGTEITKGSLVVWVPYEYDKEIGQMLGDDRKGWVGYVVAIANPVLKIDTGWSIAKRLV
ncbi:hypothetical protein QZR43_09880 [Serratia marcescens]|uniref:hypothetical protein n=1 Tax=Serratia marcescens TaxID=615 RepID=UPI002771E6C5|nr:hypothetical protein [Serratia marcescens]MDP8772893.1 hypothetical protein [Serratia marcescens]MDP8803299.1 hypothetical protein [Serratia marcescens]